ncbi:hypothetical protein K457DRAFT_842622 [Linnemannia elongata AG-77]|uniref:Uncharacterized protein n=1 Tax=Linnemannia elongata AG-77 TaxID=1314771 RepID=A0A197JGL6_9FUNG|nr:hypothetical protein K457DRAFT_842622 [Linnemannia elongata AG-77]
MHVLLQYLECDRGKKQLDLLRSLSSFEVVSDHLAVDAVMVSTSLLRDNLRLAAKVSVGNARRVVRTKDEVEEQSSDTVAVPVATPEAPISAARQETKISSEMETSVTATRSGRKRAASESSILSTDAGSCPASEPTTPAEAKSSSFRGNKKSPVSHRKLRASPIAEPWRTLVDQVMAKVRGDEHACLDAEWPSHLNGAHAKLFNFIMAKINSEEQLTKLDEKDLL